MTFNETIYALREATEEMDIFAMISAMISYGYATVGMGLRASYYDELHNDPIIDGNVFMIAGDAFDTRTWEKIPTTTALNDTPMECICIRPIAIYGWPSVKVDLGDYAVKSMNVEAFTEVGYLAGYRKMPATIRLHIKRK